MNQSDNIVTADKLAEAQIAAQLAANPAMIPTYITASIAPVLESQKVDVPQYEA